MQFKFSSQSKFENSEKHRKLLAIMQEFGLIQGGYVPYREAVAMYCNWLNNDVKPFEYKLFGEYSFRVSDYELLTEREFEAICDIFRSYKPKKLFSGVKMYRREFATDELYRNEKVKFLKPGAILWEVTGLDLIIVRQMARQASQITDAMISVYDARGVSVMQ